MNINMNILNQVLICLSPNLVHVVHLYCNHKPCKNIFFNQLCHKYKLKNPISMAQHGDTIIISDNHDALHWVSEKNGTLLYSTYQIVQPQNVVIYKNIVFVSCYLNVYCFSLEPKSSQIVSQLSITPLSITPLLIIPLSIIPLSIIPLSIEPQLIIPSGIAIGDNCLFISDGRNNRISVFEIITKNFLYQWGKSGSGRGEMRQPVYLYFHQSKIFVADMSNNRIQVFTTQGQFLYMFGHRCHLNNVELDQPCYIQISSINEVYIVNRGNKTIVVTTLLGKYLRTLDTIITPQCIILHLSGSLYINAYKNVHKYV